MPLCMNSVPKALAALIAIAAASSAVAADLVTEPLGPAMPGLDAVSTPFRDWDGSYAGIALGYGFSGKAKQGAISISPKGIAATGFAGWNLQSDRFVYGMEADLGYNAMKGSSRGYTARGRFDATLRARVGYAMGRLLPYLTAGGALGRLMLAEGGGSDTHTMLGWVAGGGMDMKLTRSMFGRVEYRHTHYGDRSFATGSGAGNARWSSNKVLFGIGMEF